MKLRYFHEYEQYVIDHMIPHNISESPVMEQIAIVTSILWDVVPYKDLKKYEIVAFPDPNGDTVMQVYGTTRARRTVNFENDVFFRVLPNLRIVFNTGYRLDLKITEENSLWATHQTMMPS